MEISLDRIGKRFRGNWVFRGLDRSIVQAERLAVLGPNGSGKSTLLQIMAGLLLHSEGEVNLLDGNRRQLSPEEHVQAVSFTAPYLDLPEELPLGVLIKHHFRFRPLKSGLSGTDLPAMWMLEREVDVPVRYFSSGMKQRVKLGLALTTETPIVLLDEPLTNLDDRGREWYFDQIHHWTVDRTIIVASNRPDEYAFCTSQLDIRDFAGKERANPQS